MTAEELKERISNLSIWKKNGQRAPHKPLLLLYALGQFQNGRHLHLPYEVVKEKLKRLLIEFGPPRKSYHPEEPFVRLENDGIWKLNKQVDKQRFTDKQLLITGIVGGFNAEVIELLSQNQSLIHDLSLLILEEHFPETMHDDILQEVGLDFRVYKKRLRDPHFRERILRAYEHSCAICGFNVRLGQNLVAVEAAHIQWHQAGGPDQEDNGIALCSLHHKLFDRGVFTISSAQTMIVSENAHGTHGFDDWLLRFHGKAVREPVHPDYVPRHSYIDWHVSEVFKGKPRYIC